MSGLISEHASTGDQIDTPSPSMAAPIASLTSKTIQGFGWSFTGTLISMFLQISFTAIMARLVDPSSYGLIAMANIVLRFGSYFSQMGIGPALIQKKDLTKDDIAAAFTSSILLGFLFYGVFWLIAPLASLWFRVEEVTPVVRLMAFSFVLSGVSVTATSLMRRDLKFRSLAICEVMAFALGAAFVGIPLAYAGFGVWSLALSSLAQAALLAVLSYIYGRHSLKLSFSFKRNQALYRFGGKFSVISFLEFLTYSIDSIFIGRFLGSEKLGIYNRATLLINLPSQSITTSMSKVLFPSFSRIQSDLTKLKEAFTSVVAVYGIVLFPICFGVSVAAPEIVSVVLGPQWIETIPILQVFALAVPFHLMLHFDGLILDATANLNIKLVTRIAHLATLAILFILLSGLGLVGFAVAMVIGEGFFYLVYSFWVSKILHIRVSEMLKLHIPMVAIGICVALCIYVLSFALRLMAWPSWLILLLQILVGAVTLVAYIAVRPPQQLKTQLEKRLLAGDITLDRFGIMRRLLGGHIQLPDSAS